MLQIPISSRICNICVYIQRREGKNILRNNKFLNGTLIGITIIEKINKTFYIGVDRSSHSPYKYQLQVFYNNYKNSDYNTIYKRQFNSLNKTKESYNELVKKYRDTYYINCICYMNKENDPSLRLALD